MRKTLFLPKLCLHSSRCPSCRGLLGSHYVSAAFVKIKTHWARISRVQIGQSFLALSAASKSWFGAFARGLLVTRACRRCRALFRRPPRRQRCFVLHDQASNWLLSFLTTKAFRQIQSGSTLLLDFSALCSATSHGSSPSTILRLLSWSVRRSPWFP